MTSQTVDWLTLQRIVSVQSESWSVALAVGGQQNIRALAGEVQQPKRRT